ncbi:hypothetical protein B0I35DRAFT_434429 [Stachybotrys elegans]|uniref:Uncharacterized protein n=1 Tax=Stachybotrys elegans TaxID=80388 RepID=A0A8K0WRC0_9HYPO|nr:hypothetical protein B0I35DRAFT_434429 [Stachybotrys elegans]
MQEVFSMAVPMPQYHNDVLPHEPAPARDEGPSKDSIISDDTMPAIIELLVLDQVESAKANTTNGAEAISQTKNVAPENVRHSRQLSRDKVMTAAQFEMYRRAFDTHHVNMGADDDDSQDEYEDKDDDDDDERRKLAASKQRQRQASYLANRRVGRSKVAGGENKPPQADAGISRAFESWDDLSKTTNAIPTISFDSRSNSTSQDDDDDVPLALLKRSQTPTFDRALNARPGAHSRSSSYQHHPVQPYRFVERPQTRLTSHAPKPSLQPLPVLQPSLYPPHQGMGHRRGGSTGVSMTMSNASLPSLVAQPVYQRPHTSGGLITAIDHLQSPNTRPSRYSPPRTGWVAR